MLLSAPWQYQGTTQKSCIIFKGDINKNKKKTFMKRKMETAVRIWENIALKITFIYHFSLQSCDL